MRGKRGSGSRLVSGKRGKSKGVGCYRGSKILDIMESVDPSNINIPILDLSSGGLGYDGSDMTAINWIAEALQPSDSSKLRSLDLSYNLLDETAGIALAPALATNAVLTSFNLSINDIGPNGGKAIAKALKVNSVLIDLNLASNNIGMNGAIAIAEALKSSTSRLKILNLSSNKLCVGTSWMMYDSQKAIKAIAGALKDNNMLTNLNLSSNEIDRKGAMAIADALKSQRVLTHLDLKYNNMGVSERDKKVMKEMSHRDGLTLLL